MRIISLAVAGCLVALMTPASAQTAPETDIIVEAPQPSDAQGVRAFVGALTSPRQRTALPRWNSRICTGIVGLQPQFARALNDRIARVAHRYDLRTGDVGCDPNVIIMFTSEPEEAARMLTARPGEAMDAAAAALAPDPDAPLRAVRWWHVSATTVDGREISRDGTVATRDDEPAPPDAEGGVSPGITSTNAARVRDATRLRNTSEQVLIRAVMVIDNREIDGVPVRALADFITMVTLAQIDPNADVSDAPTILNLFSQLVEDAPDGMTGWDYAYLDALYASRLDVRDADQHQRLIVADMIQSSDR